MPEAHGLTLLMGAIFNYSMGVGAIGSTSRERLPGRQLVNVLKIRGHAGDAGKARTRGNGFYRQVAVAEKFFNPLQAHTTDFFRNATVE